MASASPSSMHSGGPSSLVTGATGFLGRHLVRSLVEHGHTVTALGRQCPNLVTPSGVRYQYGDILNQRCLADATRNVSVVYHLAAIVPGKGGQAEQWRVNHYGTRVLLQACIENGVKRLVFLSSVCAYAPPLKALLDEDSPTGGGDSYGQSKAAAELEIANAATNSLSSVILRPSQVYGPGDGGFTAMLVSMLSGKYLYTAGRSPRPFSLVYVDDLIEAIVRAGTSRAIGSDTLNIAGPPTHLQALTSAYAAITGHEAKCVPLPIAVVRLAQELRWFSRNLSGNAMRPRWKSYAADQVYGSVLLGGPEYSVNRAKLALAFEAKTSIQKGLANVLNSHSHDSSVNSNVLNNPH
ncbi:NAD-dependent epimerase/dehydratase family protein [Methylomonas montana]|uniref:NAD-dependent epimerase/dehydratase family protein n=1 Tax=Methylomonas montana TaxID=3058963 RepID=UPI0026581A61|nr:NAD-dependent epimerase/dehydratase family protein [Methylomonas montana]WKJ91177.1 NAD-dependent epimerase/dehydratase family protein [Methylomonas montana]